MRCCWKPVSVAVVVASAMIGAAEIAILCAQYFPVGNALDRLYAGVFLGFASAMAVLFWALFAPGWSHAVRRACLWLAVLTSSLLMLQGY